jgi:type IV pilus assembly protein PilY1
MKTNPTRIAFAWRAGAVALTLALGLAGISAHAATTTLSNLPIASKVTAKPNIVYTLDDSGSMSYNYIPDYTILNYCRSGTGLTACAGTANFNFPPFLTADFNRMYYNPNITYTAPKKFDGTSYPDQNSANTTAWTKVVSDPYLPVGGPFPTVDLITAAAGKGLVSVPVYCNSDWPLVGTSYVTGDVGDANGENDATVHNSKWSNAGEHCRINGNDYKAIGAAPAISADYNYPWQPTVTPPNAQYFFRNGGTKTLWCDATAAGWPRATTGGTCSYTCTLGGTYTPPTPVVQTCNAGAVTKQCCTALNSPAGCPSASTYSPAGCKTSTNPEYCSPGIGLPGECTPGCACNTLRTGQAASCSSTGASCGCTDSPPGTPCTIVVNGNAACPNTTPNPTNANCSAGVLVATCTAPAASANCTDKVWDPVNKVYTTTTLQQDAALTNGGTGAVCRQNNFDYTSIGGPAKSPVNYTNLPLDVKFKTTVTGGCPTYASSINIPRHYYTVGFVEFCKNLNATNNAQWKGFGVNLPAGTCQSKDDFSVYVNVHYGTFARVDLVNDGRVFNYVDPYSGLPGTRTFAQEMTNYSNWYAYYRTRVLAAKTTTAIAFNFLDATYRVGFHTMNTPTTNWVDVNDWVSAQRNSWYSKLFGVSIGTGITPTINAMLRVGELFKTGTGGQGVLPSSTNMPEGYIPASATDPVTVSCQKNYHILFTDGFTNQFFTPTIVGEVDGGNIPSFPADPDPVNHPEVTVAGLRALTGTPWINPFKDPTPTPNSLSDIGLYYWQNDLRPSGTWPANIAKDNVPSASGLAGADKLWTNDPAFWQHVNFSAISFGSEGILDASNAPAVTDLIAAGTVKWFVAPNTLTPTPALPTTPAGNKGATAVDDLWHATVNSRGTFVYAEDPLQVSQGLGTILAGIQNSEKSRAGAAFSTNVLTAANHAIFQPTIEPGWAGDLKKIEIDPTTAAYVSTDWSAGVILNTLLATPAIPPASDSLYPWFANRRVVTFNGVGTPFLYANLSAAQLASLGGSAAAQQKVIAYLRGGSVAGAPTPVPIEGTKIGQFRKRFGKLGDISDSEPLYLGPPNSPWDDSTDPGYSAFVAAQASRAARIYVGANDGMMHAFDVNTGDETFAFIPSAVMNSLVDEDGAPKGIQALTFQDGGAPIFKHHFYVNATARSSDVDFNNTGGAGGSGAWHTILVGGLGKGGKSYYAIDVTTPITTSDTEAAAAGKVLWEFSDPDMQFSFSRPVIGKTRADGWVVIVANGYNSVSGKGKIYMINPKTGALIRTLTTTAADTGSAGSPSGLAQINGFTLDFHNQIIEQIYGGDLNGNVWRWDISDPVVANWKTALFAQLTPPATDTSTVLTQPVTTAPQIEIDLNNGNDRWVFVGTGRLLDNLDLVSPLPGVIAPLATPQQIQTFYAIRDGTLTTPSTAGLPIQPRITLVAANALTTGPLVGAVPNGWFMDLPLGQRIVVDPNAELNVATFIATYVQNPPDQCLTSLPAYLYAREYTSAESDVVDPITNTIVPSGYSALGAVGLGVVALVDPSSSFPKLAGVISPENGSNPLSFKFQPHSFGGQHRMSWRMLGN